MYQLITTLLFVRSLVCYFNIYPTDRIINNEIIQYDCLRYYVPDDIIAYEDLPSRAHQIIPYCMSLVDRNKWWNDTEIDGTPHQFINLAQNNVTGSDLIAWSASVDVVERFEMYLMNNHIELLGSQIFYNCTWPLFGTFCQYSFELSENSFSDKVRSIFATRNVYTHVYSRITNATCYVHLRCYRGPPPSCLDWREICDGKIDCLDGQDEDGCSSLKISECTENEYRCRNGQCIPEEFLWDNLLNPDCLDRTDIASTRYPSYCQGDPSFRCEEHSCRSPLDFKCGDGSCGGRSGICANRRDLLLIHAILSRAENLHLSYKCWEGMIFTTKIYKLLDGYNRFLFVPSQSMSKYADDVEKYCPSHFLFPRHPFTFGHVKFIYTNTTTDENNIIWTPTYICYNKKLCDFLSNTITIEINGSDCVLFHELGLTNLYTDWWELDEALHNVFRVCSTTIRHEKNSSILFQCLNSSKFISKHHLVDSYIDCPNGADELFNDSCSLNDKYRFACAFENKCISPIAVLDGKWDCILHEDEEAWASGITKKTFAFQLLCDGINDNLIDQENETDETHCEEWLCDNHYTHCNGFWNCLNGADETNCGSGLCPSDSHPCISPITHNLTCLSLGRVNDGIDDCLGGADERQLCRKFAPDDFSVRFRCWNLTIHDENMCISTSALCDTWSDCKFHDDELYCENFYRPNFDGIYLCGEHIPRENRTDIQDVLCNLTETGLLPYVYFSLQQSLRNYMQKITHANVHKQIITVQQDSLVDFYTLWYCNRGILIHVEKSNEKRCLCPPAYYGSRCELQNQRLSLTLQFQKESSPAWNTIFHFFILLMEDNEHFNSYEEIIYFPSQDCKIKFNVNLLYRTRPKNLSKNYHVRIDAFNKHDLTYHGSWYLILQFPFLPVNRLSALIYIPSQRLSAKSNNCPLKCGLHGQCMHYVNRPTDAFCQCDEGWSGALCDLAHVCDCSSDSYCIGTFYNHSLCLCPLYKFGPRCYISHQSCKIDSCHHRGLCVSTEERGFFCICTDGFSGLQCEYVSLRLNISFSDEIRIPQSMLVHLITVSNNSKPHRITIFKKVSFDETFVSLSIATPIDIAFVEFDMNYYLTTIQQAALSSFIGVLVQITPNNRCISIHKLLNVTILHFSLLHRMKYYHKPCQSDENLKCIYDESFLCLCDEFHHANCFEFDHNMKYNCLGSSYCENSGRCFQDDPICGKSTMCECNECFYGNKCQFSNKAFGLSLDGIIGYHIRPNIVITKQPVTVKTTLILTTIIFVIGLVNGLLSTLTFQSKEPRQVGCGIYLLTSSISSLITIILLQLKVWILLTSQIGLISNRNMLLLSCVANDSLLKISVNFGNWINACVSIERCLTVIKGISFDKVKSIRASKWAIIIIFLLTVLSTLPDPISRSLIDDVEDQRTWCISVLSSVMQVVTSVLNLFHFFAPFLSNTVSTLVIIVQSTRKRFAARSQLAFRKHLYAQVQQCKHMLISSFLLVLLSLPSLVISFVSGCMKSAHNPWLYLVSYFISFMPSILIFPIFVLPSKTYRKVFINEMRRIKSIINCWLPF